MTAPPVDASALVAPTDPLGDAVRRLVDAVVRTEVPESSRLTAAAMVAAVTAELASVQRTGPAQRVPRQIDAAQPFWWHNPVLGPGNPMAPPMAFRADENGLEGLLHLGSPYEGPPGYVHGGILSLVLDQALGIAAAAAGHPGMTGQLELRYRQATPLFTDLHVTARVEDVSGRKVRVVGAIASPEAVCVEAVGLFLQLQPQSARRLFSHLSSEE